MAPGTKLSFNVSIIMKRISPIVLLCAGVAVFLNSAQAQIQPEAKEVFERSIEAVGGRDKIESLESIKMSVVMSMPAMGMSMNATFIRKSPNLFYMEQEVPGMGTVKSAYDGETGWIVMPMQGYRELGEAELAQQIEEQDIHGDLKYAERYTSANVSGKELIDGIEHTIVTAVKSNGGTEDKVYFNIETGLMRRISTVANSGPMGEFPVEMEIATYAETDGFQMPAKVEIKNPAMNMNMEFKDYEFNGEIDDSIFSPPAE